MPWYLYSLPTALSLVGVYLGVKWLTSRAFEPRHILLFMIGFATLGFLGLAAPSLPAVLASERFPGFLASATFAGLFAATGHWADFEAIKRAPNPGLATAIRNSTIVPVSLLSTLLFGSAFSPLKLLGTLLVLAGVAALVVERRASARGDRAPAGTDRRWATLALAAVASYTLMVLGIKRATLLGFAAPEICLWIYVVNLVFFAALCRADLRGYLRDRARLTVLLPATVVCAVFAVAVNLLNVKGVALAPNPGYHEAIRSTSVLFVTLLAIPLFSARIDARKALGVVLVVVGSVVLVV